MIEATGSETNPAPQYPCFQHPTLTDPLDTQGLTWRYYAPSARSIWTGPDAIEHICQQQTINGKLTCKGPIWTANVVIPQSQVLVEIANGQLAQVSLVIPDGKSSDHALANDGSGPAWVASIVNAIGNSAYWANTAIIIAWDDWGGWYDHVTLRSSTMASARGRDMSTVFVYRSSWCHPTRKPHIFLTPHMTSAASSSLLRLHSICHHWATRTLQQTTYPIASTLPSGHPPLNKFPPHSLPPSSLMARVRLPHAMMISAHSQFFIDPQHQANTIFTPTIASMSEIAERTIFSGAYVLANEPSTIPGIDPSNRLTSRT